MEVEQYRDSPIKYINITEYKTIKTYPVSDDVVFVVLAKNIDWNKISKEYHRMVFQSNELKYNILDNIMVPHHERIKENIFEDRDLPIIKSNDIVVRRMNFRVGDIIKITRKSGLHYRKVS